MAALGTIRSRGAILIGIIGLGLFAFIAGDLFKSCEGSKAEQSQRMAEIAGEKVNVQEYQKYAEEFAEFMKIEGRQESDEQLREMAWNYFLQEKLVTAEAQKLGLTVTDEEVNDLMTKGVHPALANFPIPQVHNQQTGLFDVNAYRQYVNSVKDAAEKSNNPQAVQLYNYLLFKEKQLRTQLLFEKYNSLLQACSVSNAVEAKFLFDAEKKESDIVCAAYDFRAINDSTVTVADADLKSKYEELKEGARIKLDDEVRTGKLIVIRKEASDNDKAELNALLAEAAAKLDSVPANTDSVKHCVREFESDVQYAGVPVTKNALSPAVANMVDSIGVNVVKGPFFDAADNTMNVIRVFSKASMPDSIQFRAIGVQGENQAETATRADSIVKAIQGGEDFEVLAKKYGDTGEKQWMVTNQYERANVDAEMANLISTIHNMTVNEMKVINYAGNKLIVQVLDQKKPVQKYVLAQVKREITYSPETSRQFNEKMRLFLADNRKVEDIEKNAAQNNFTVVDLRDLREQNLGVHSSSYNYMTTTPTGMTRIDGSGAKEMFRWIFNEDRKVGDLSDEFECEEETMNGDKNTVLVAVALTGIYDGGYRPMDDAMVNEYVKQMALNDKKAEKIIEATKSVNSIDAAKAVAGLTCRVDTIAHVSFANYRQEPKLAGAVAASKPGFCKTPVKGNNGVYFFQVTEQRTLEGTYDEKQYRARAAQNFGLNQNVIFGELMRNAKITDKRYIF